MKRWLTFHRIAVQVHQQNPSIDKSSFGGALASRFGLQLGRKVYYAEDFAVRFSFSAKAGFSNTVVGLREIKNFDDRPFLVCLLRPTEVQTLLANSSLIKKVSHSSQKLSMTCIRGSINGSDILRELDGVSNKPENFEALYELHASFTWQENLERIVTATGAITATGRRFEPTAQQVELLLQAPLRSREVEDTGRLAEIEGMLQRMLSEREPAVLSAAEIDNVNLRGNAIEQLPSTGRSSVPSPRQGGRAGGSEDQDPRPFVQSEAIQYRQNIVPAVRRQLGFVYVPHWNRPACQTGPRLCRRYTRLTAHREDPGSVSLGRKELPRRYSTQRRRTPILRGWLSQAS